MKVESWLFGAGAFFFAPVGVIYGILTHWDEPVGPVGLFLTAGLALMVGWYLWYTARHIDPRPEDDPAAPIEAAAGEYGFFSPHSWWPLPLAASCAVMFLGPGGRLVAAVHRPGTGLARPRRLGLRVLARSARALTRSGAATPWFRAERPLCPTIEWSPGPCRVGSDAPTGTRRGDVRHPVPVERVARGCPPPGTAIRGRA